MPMSLPSTATRPASGKDEESSSAELARLEASKTEFSQTLAARQLELELWPTAVPAPKLSCWKNGRPFSTPGRDLDAVELRDQGLRARRDSLDQILQHRAYANTSVKRLFAAIEHNQVPGLKPVGVLADFVELKDPRFERATEEFLHEELEYVVVRDWEEAQRGVDLLRAELDGRATFLVEPDFSNDGSVVHSAPVPEPPIGPETGIVGRLCDGIRFTNGLTNAPAELLPRLARCYFAESRSCAELLAFEYPDLFFLLDDGVCYHGHAVTGGNKTASGPLAMKRELRELSVSYEKKQREAAAGRERLDSLEQVEPASGRRTGGGPHRAAEAGKGDLTARSGDAQLSEESRRAAQRLSASRLELDRLARDSARTLEERERKQALVAEKDEARSALERALEDGRSELEQLRIGVAQLAEEHSVLRVDLAGLEERCRGVEDAMARLDQQQRELSIAAPVSRMRSSVSPSSVRASWTTIWRSTSALLLCRTSCRSSRTLSPPWPRAKPPSAPRSWPPKRI